MRSSKNSRLASRVAFLNARRLSAEGFSLYSSWAALHSSFHHFLECGVRVYSSEWSCQARSKTPAIALDRASMPSFTIRGVQVYQVRDFTHDLQ